MSKTKIWRRFIGATLLTFTGATAAASDEVVEIGGRLQEWNLTSGYIVIGDVRYRTMADVNIRTDDGTPLSGRSLQPDMDVFVHQVGGLVTEIVVVRSRPAPEPQ